MAVYILAFFLLSMCTSPSSAERVEVRVNATGKTSGGEKEITYIRHGKSAGNAMSVTGIWSVLWEKGDIRAYRDGQLMQKGVNQAADRVEAMDMALLERINNAELIMISPLARAMATAIIVVAHAKYRYLLLTKCTADGVLTDQSDDCVSAAFAETGYLLPRVEVAVELREKVKSDSERIGTGVVPSLDYVIQMCEMQGESLFGKKDSLNMMCNAIRESYQEYGDNFGVEPDNTDMYIAQINSFKKRLADVPESKVLLVGHSGWARFAFSAFLPAKGVETLDSNVMQAQREVHPLNNCGVLQANFNRNGDKLFRDVVVDKITPGNEGFPNLETSGKPGVFTNIEEAKLAGKVPADTLWDHQMLKKRSKGFFIGGIGAKDNKRFFTFTASAGQAWLSWASKWGDAKNHMSIKEGEVAYHFNKDHELIITPQVISSKDGKMHDAFTVIGDTGDEVDSFYQKLLLFGQSR